MSSPPPASIVSGAGAADEQVGAVVAEDLVGPRAAVDLVGAVAALQRVVARVAVDDVRAVVAGQDVAGGAAVDEVVAVAAGDVLGPRLAEELVVAVAALDEVRAAAALDRVVARAAVEAAVVAEGRVDDQVVARLAEDVVVAGAAVEVVVAGAAVDRVVARPAVGAVVAVAAGDVVVARAAVEGVVAGVAEEVVVVGAAAQGVVAVAALEDVVLAPAVEHVVAAEAGDEVAQARAGDGVRRVGALHAGRARAGRRRPTAWCRAAAPSPAGDGRSGLTSESVARAAVGVVDADAVGRPARRARAATGAEAAHAMPGDVDERGQVAAVRGADRQRQPVGRRGHGAADALAQAQRVLLGLARALAHDVQAPGRADPRARRGIERGARRALDLHAAQQLRPAGGHHRDAAAGQDHGRQRSLAREGQRARRPAQADAVADGQRPGVEHEEPPSGGRVDGRAAR